MGAQELACVESILGEPLRSTVLITRTAQLFKST